MAFGTETAIVLAEGIDLARSTRTGQVKLGAMRVAIAGLAVLLALVAWVAVLVGTDVDQDQQMRQTQARAGNMALLFEEQIYRQILSIDETLRILKLEWERNPAAFDIASLQRRAGSLSDLVAQLVILDSRGRVVGGTQRELLDTDMSGRRYFAMHRAGDSFGPMITGPFQLNGAWVLNISRRLNGPHGMFGGVVVASYDLNALMRDMSQTDLGPRGMVMLVGRDGLVRAISLHGAKDPGNDISNTPLFHAMFQDGVTSWTGMSGPDRDQRIHAWRPIPNAEMTLVVGLDRAAALAGSEIRRREALIGATVVTFLVLILAIAVGSMISAAAAREQRLARDRATLEAANLQLARARERADEKSLQLGMTLAGMSDGLSMFNGSEQLVEWNRQYADLTGVPQSALRVDLGLEEVLRLHLQAGEFGTLDPEAEMQRELALMRSVSWPKLRVRNRPNGSVVEHRSTRLPDGGWVTLCSDITARKQSEDAQSRARELAEIAAQEKSRFVAIVSHEIRTPLNVAINSLSLLDSASLSSAQRQLVETGLMAGEALMGLLNDILDLSRLQVGRLQLRPAPFALRPLMEGVADLFRQQASERGVELSVNIAPGIPERLMTDAGRLRQAMMNLVNNAAKFAEPGPATIGVGFATLDGAPVLRFAVRDCGPEIPDLDRARLFRPFSQLEKQGSSGTGLGLAICQLLANLLGGQIGCDSVGDGCKEFWLTLPADVMDVPAQPAPKVTNTSGPEWLPRTRILLVEDVPANQMIVATVLRREGHMVDVASSGLEALAMVASRAYDLVFLDIFMPGIDGLETARRIRAMPGQALNLPLIALTANVSPMNRADYLAAGMNDLVPKPVERTALLSVLARYVWFGRRMAAVHPGQRLVHEDVRTEAAVDLARTASLRSGLSSEVCDALFADSLRQLRDMVPSLETALRLRDRLAVKRVTHAMFGVAGNYGFSALESMLKALGLADLESLDAFAEAGRVDREIDRVEEAVRNLPEAAAA